MDEWQLLILLVLAIPVVAIVALVFSIGARDRLRVLEWRISGIEAKLAAIGGAPAAAPPALAAEAAPVPETMVAGSTEKEPQTPEQPAVEVPLPPLAPAKPKIGWEERFGTQWSVWLGGLALALGGFFLVKYSIEQGWFGPEARVALGAILALVLIAAGEWTRRHEIKTGLTGLPAAHIPSILTAAGTTVAYATVYASYALYGFIDAGAAFLLLGIVALGTLATALLHGPAVAGLGLVGAYLAPLIVRTETPNYWALYLYLAFVTSAAFGLARARLWRWLALVAVGLSLLWLLPGIGNIAADVLSSHIFYVVACFAFAAILIVSGFLFGPDAEPGRVDFVSSLALGVYLLGVSFMVWTTQHDLAALITFLVLVAGTVAIAWRTDAAIAAVPWAAILTALLFFQWSTNIDIQNYGLPIDANAAPTWQPDRFIYGTHLWLGAGLAFIFGVSGFLAQMRSESVLISRFWAASAVFAPTMILALLYYRIAEFDRSIPFAAAALGLAVAYAFATDYISRREPRPGSASAIAIFITGAVAALAIGLTMVLEKGWLTTSFALMVAGIAWIASARPMPGLRWLAGAITALVLSRFIWYPMIMGPDVGTAPIFNWLLYGYGVPAASFWVAGYLMRREEDDEPLWLVESAAIFFTALLGFLEIRHYMTGGNAYQSSDTLAELALDVCFGFGFAIVLEKIRERTGSVMHNIGALIVTSLTLLAIVIGLGVAYNPAFSNEPVGRLIFNTILLGYGITAVLASCLALITRDTRPRWHSALLAIVAVALALGYLSLQVMRIYHGPVLTDGPTTDAEQYTYSAVWLAFGVVLLATGIYLRSLPLRVASAAVVLLTVFKVFFVDMSDLTGIYRALSFIGLGAVLMGIGWFYQRLLFPKKPPELETAA
ncbi:MAG TPA: DUF2339 domain-containing protein [Methyloceanibacter sp.]